MPTAPLIPIRPRSPWVGGPSSPATSLLSGSGTAGSVATSSGAGQLSLLGAGAGQDVASTAGAGLLQLLGSGPTPTMLGSSSGAGQLQLLGLGSGSSIATSAGAGQLGAGLLGSGVTLAIATTTGSGRVDLFGSGSSVASSTSAGSGVLGTPLLGAGSSASLASSSGAGRVDLFGSGPTPTMLGSSSGSGQLQLLGSGVTLAVATTTGLGGWPLAGSGVTLAIATSAGAGVLGSPEVYPEPTPVRDWDILDAIIAAIKGTRKFQAVHASDLPEIDGQKAEHRAVAVVSPLGGDEEDGGFDDPMNTQWTRTVQWRLTILARDHDPRTRDRLAERLLNYARAAVDADAAILDTTVIGMTHLYRDRWLPAVPPERRIEAIGTFTYFVNGPSDHATDL